MIIEEDDYIEHYGTPRHSGRYPWGSTHNVPGSDEDTIQRHASWLDYVNDLKKQGLSDVDIAQGMGISTTQLRARKSISRAEKKAAEINMAQRLSDKGTSNTAIAERMGLSGESFVRTLLAPGAMEKAKTLTNVADLLQKHVDEKKFVEVGAGVENQLKISKEKLNAALAILKEKGYVTHSVPVPQLGTTHETNTRVLAQPGTTWGEVRKNLANIQTITAFSDDGSRTPPHEIHDPLVINPNRLQVRYANQGGDKADGVIFVRPGVPDISLGSASYAQVRVKVGKDHYIKGMAMYKQGLPDGVDLVFNTKKDDETGNKLDALKKIEDNSPELPFGAIVRQIPKDPKDPNSPPGSAMNLVNSEGAWKEWSGQISSQFLSKQSPALAKAQLDLTFNRRKKEFDEINQLTNPVVKKKLFKDFADSAESSAQHLKAVALPRMHGWHVILPIESMKPDEVYAPNFDNGDRVVLIRHPHGGTFEIPELTVNNRQREANTVMKNAQDAIGINSSVAERLSGADFDGDTVLVIPNKQGKVKVTSALEGLKGFDPIREYPGYEGMPEITDDRKGQLMGDISNLITDMTIRRASREHLARAIRHSMVVIDAQNHHLNYKLSAERNGIAALKKEYQGRTNAGASTLISRKKSFDVLPQRKLRPASQGGAIDPKTGRLVFVPTGKTRLDKEGNRVPRTERVNKLRATPDAHTLSSGTPMETIYAEHSNRLKDLAGQARLTSIKAPRLQHLSSSKKVYAKERTALLAKLATAESNAPRERAAQRLGVAAYRAKLQANPQLDKDTKKKLKFQELERARLRMGAKKEKIRIEPNEWDAIQAGAISTSVLNRILTNADTEEVKKLATPKNVKLMSPSYVSRAKRMFDAGYTRAEVASRLGVSLSTLDASVKGSEQ